MPILRALAAITLGLLLAGCSSDLRLASPEPSVGPSADGSSSPAVAPPEHAALVTIATRGGLCPNGPCAGIVVIGADGQIRQLLPKDAVLGVVPPGILDALGVEMARVDFALLESRPFTGECPTAFDGQETIYTFHLSTGDESMASCTVAIDPDHPLFRAVAAALAGASTR